VTDQYNYHGFLFLYVSFGRQKNYLTQNMHNIAASMTPNDIDTAAKLGMTPIFSGHRQAAV